MSISAERRIDSLFQPWTAPGSPGCSVGIYVHGEIAFSRGYGLASVEHGVPNRPDTVFRIASTSKQFTAAAAFLLAEEGLLDLDGDIREVLPELPDWGHRVTARHLIHHTSGIRDYIMLLYLPGMDDRDHLDEGRVFELLCSQNSLHFPPGEQHLYCNSGYFLLGLMVGRISGGSLRTYADKAIFAPLGMGDTHFHDDPRELVVRRAYGHEAAEGTGFLLDPANTEVVGDGGAFTTVLDLFHWHRNFSDNRLGKGSPEFLRAMTTPGRTLDGNPIPYAGGLVPGSYRGREIISHEGFYAGFRAEFLRFPTLDVTVVCLANVSTLYASPMALRTADLWLGSQLEGSSPVRTPRSREHEALEKWQRPAGLPNLKAYEGVFRSEELNLEYCIRLQDGVVFLDAPRSRPLALQFLCKETFATSDFTIVFERNPRHRIFRFLLHTERARRIVFTKLDQ